MKRYKPLIDKLYFMITIPTLILIAAATALVCVFPEPLAILIIIPVDLLIVYFLVSPLFGYVELREDTLFIKYGFMLKKEIPYSKIRSLQKGRRWYSETMMSLKNAFEHVEIKYNSFDVTTVSVINNENLIKEINDRI